MDKCPKCGFASEMSAESERDGNVTHFPCGTRTINGEVHQTGAACERLVHLADLLAKAEGKIRNSADLKSEETKMLLDDIVDELIAFK